MDHSANPAWPAEHAWGDGAVSTPEDAATLFGYHDVVVDPRWLAMAKTAEYKAVQQLTCFFRQAHYEAERKRFRDWMTAGYPRGECPGQYW